MIPFETDLSKNLTSSSSQLIPFDIHICPKKPIQQMSKVLLDFACRLQKTNSKFAIRKFVRYLASKDLELQETSDDAETLKF